MPFSFKTLSNDLTVRDYKRQFEELQRLGKFSVNDYDSADPTKPLIVSAAERGFTNAVKALLADPTININATDGQKRTALHVACDQGSINLIKLLLGYKVTANENINYPADITLADKDRKTPLSLLPKSDQVSVDLPQLLLYQACELGRLDVLQALINISVKLNQLDTESRSPLHLAADNGHLPIVEHLLQCNVDLESKLQNNNTALHIAALRALPGIVDALIGKRANVYAENSDNQTPLMIAFDQPESKPHELQQIIEIFSKLPQNKFDIKKDISTRKTSQQDTYLHIAARNQIPSDCFNVLFENIDNGDAILDHRNSEGYTPLHLAVAKNIPMIAELRAKGASLSVTQSFFYHRKQESTNRTRRWHYTPTPHF